MNRIDVKSRAISPKAPKAVLTARPPRLMVVDDDAGMRLLCVRMLRPGYDVVDMDSGLAALEYLNDHPVDVLLTDLDMPEMNGLTLVAQVRRSYPQVPSMIMTATMKGDSRRSEAEGLGVTVLSKPFSQQQLLECLERIRASVPAVLG